VIDLATAVEFGFQPTRGLFARELLRELACPRSRKNMIALVAWMEGEGSKARYNPLATTHTWPGATNFNSAGVKHYPTLAAGIQATIATLKNGHYQPILAALKRGDNIQHIAAAVEASPWGTQLVPWQGVNTTPKRFAAILVAS
jgi:hypothetical protein